MYLQTFENTREMLKTLAAGYISLVFSNARHALSQYNTRARLLYL